MEYSDVYSKKLGSLWQCCRDEPVLDNNNNIIDFSFNNNNSILFNVKQEISWKTGSCDTKVLEVKVLLKYISNFWKTLELLLINCEINFQLRCISVSKMDFSRWYWSKWSTRI